jgi:sugar lactone lactonase YvrE
MPCFCGPDLTLLVVTSLSVGLDATDADGNLFMAKSLVTGAPVARMKGI